MSCSNNVHWNGMMGKEKTIGIYVWLRNCLAYLEKKKRERYDADANANNVTKGVVCYVGIKNCLQFLP